MHAYLSNTSSTAVLPLMPYHFSVSAVNVRTMITLAPLRYKADGTDFAIKHGNLRFLRADRSCQWRNVWWYGTASKSVLVFYEYCLSQHRNLLGNYFTEPFRPPPRPRLPSAKLILSDSGSSCACKVHQPSWSLDERIVCSIRHS